MKKMFVLSILALSLAAPSVKASECSEKEAYASILGLTLIASITLAPTGTSFIISMTHGCNNRELVLNLKEDAAEYMMGSSKTSLLDNAISTAQAQYPQMSEEEIVGRFATMQMQ
jgi:hypothetical protein